jgi:hypothetical protein
MSKLLYTEHKGRVIAPDARFKHVMAITLNPKTSRKDGIVRCIVSRTGDPSLSGNVDRSELCKVSGESLENFKIGEHLNIKNEKEIIDQLVGDGEDFIGLEDPDIFIDEKTDLVHVYFTIPLKPDGTKNLDNNKKTKVYLGHAMGKDLDSLEMTKPVLVDSILWAKEISIAPENKKGFRYNLFESRERENGIGYSVVRLAIVKNMNESWKFGEIAFNPKEHDIPWIAKDASPGPLFSKNFIDVGEGKLLGILNGRENYEIIGTEKKLGIFSSGLFVYDYENGKIDWVSPEPLIRDSKAKNITFASQFVETGKGEGVLYAHVDDSFVRAYTLKAELLKSILPAEFVL